ncbi:eukaryotic translation initiation factor 3 subunit A-like [Musa acuminata AAA Group]|uniref:eukaryotic translation initiation factor 3 subunit A-like n=1 Tax=Musa acuminata AAA Group TaxID=214697 RepID=UPI0031D69A92
MFKYVELCVDMKRGRFAKDGLIQYRIICQQVNVSSLEEVIKHFMHLSMERAEQARIQAQALEEAPDVEGLEVDKRLEDLMLSYVSAEKGKNRSDREIVTPWFKFLWETYRTVLEFLRNNSKLESLYAVIFQQRVVNCREAEYNRPKKEREDKINQLVAMRKCEREFKRKLLFYLKSEEVRLTRLREEEEVRKHEEEERQKKEEREKRELEEKERLQREGLLRSVSVN